jgi:hypothetical protein
MAAKDRKTAGADELTPSKAQYFSWINNTNEGSTEEQTLVNLDYFRWLKEKYGMQLDIYAFDAGNLDTFSGKYYSERLPLIREKFPEGFKNIVSSASSIGTKLGMWGGPDGFGDTKEDADKRRETMITFCRDYGFALFKLDAACSGLRQEKRPEFAKMMEECRKYQPELIALNHRIDFGECEKYLTTFLWQGVETYVDVHICNPCTAPHHRAFIFTRGEVPGLQRLSEDHGVCLSSCMDRFEDDLIYQAFNRNLILSPEIYGNPWLLRDDEHAKLAYIYNLHRQYNEILVKGFILDEEKYGPNAVSRGNGERRLVSFGNASWKKKSVNVKLDEEIGLDKCEKVSVIIRHPYIQLLGEYEYGSETEITVDPFRAVLLEICDSAKAPKLLCDKPHRMIGLSEYEQVNTAYEIKKLGTASAVPVPTTAVKLAETAFFTMDHDSLEIRSLRRAGETAIPEVQKARDMFFNQKTYFLRGCEGAFAFDGKKDTFFDGVSLFRFGGLRTDNGCLRIDFGDVFNADTVEIEYFSPDVPVRESPENNPPESADISDDLLNWTKCFDRRVRDVDTAEDETVNNNLIVNTDYDEIIPIRGKRCVLSFSLPSPVRYFRMPNPVYRIYRISLFKNGKEITLKAPRVNNLLPSTESRPVIGAQQTVVRVRSEDWQEGSYLSVALEGTHGIEGAYAVIDCMGTVYGAPDRSPSFPSNVWEYSVRKTDKCYTYYFPITKNMTDRDIRVWILLFDKEHTDFTSDIYLCPPLC